MAEAFETVEVAVDEAALAPLGWTAHDVRARLVTEAGPAGSVMQRVAVAGTVRFDPAAWAERFGMAGFAPYVLLTLNRRGSAALPDCVRVVTETADVAAKRPIRFTETSDSWRAPELLRPDDLEIRLTAYDLAGVGRTFHLPSGTARALPVTVLDETSSPSLRVKVQTGAEIAGQQHADRLRVHVEGVVEPGPADRALRVPGLLVEVTDDTDFLLAQHTVAFTGEFPAQETTRVPRFVAAFRTSSASYAGTPALVTVRIRDAEDLPG